MTEEMIHSSSLLIDVARELLRDQPKMFSRIEYALTLSIVEELFKYRGQSAEKIAERLNWEESRVEAFINDNWSRLKL
jgi:hypothetical protein